MEIVYLIYYIIAVSYIIYSAKKCFITPNLIFVAAQLAMFTGIITYVNVDLEADRQLIYIYLITLVCFIISSIFHYSRYGISRKKVCTSREEDLTQTQSAIIWIMVIISVIACSYFFSVAGGNVFLNSIQSFFGSGEYSTKYGRKNILGISGVGYIYQLRVVILPILTTYLISTGTMRPKKIAWIIFPFMIILLLGTGQRGGFVMFMIIWVIALLYINRYYQENNLKKIICLGVLFFLVFAFITVLNGRVQNDGSVIGAMMNRILDDNQACAVYGFRYIVEQPTQWGKDWLAQMMDVLPGKNEYQALSVRIFAIMNGGSTAGTAPACIWGSAFYNWSWIGITVFPMLLAHFYAYMYNRFIQKKSNRLRLFLYAGIFVVLGMWIADGPMVLFNQGFVTIVLMGWLIKFSRKFVFVRR